MQPSASLPASACLPLDAAQELRKYLHVSARFLGVGHVRTVLEEDPFRAADPMMDGLGNGRGCLVVPAGSHERRDPNLTEAVHDIPIFEHAGNVKLARTI